MTTPIERLEISMASNVHREAEAIPTPREQAKACTSSTVSNWNSSPEITWKSRPPRAPAAMKHRAASMESSVLDRYTFILPCPAVNLFRRVPLLYSAPKNNPQNTAAARGSKRVYKK